MYVYWLNIFYLYGNGTIVYHSREIKWKYILPRQFLPSLVAYPVGHCLWGARGHSSQGLPQATPILPQHSDLVTSALALFSQRPLFISSQHDPFLLSTEHSKLYLTIQMGFITILFISSLIKLRASLRLMNNSVALKKKYVSAVLRNPLLVKACSCPISSKTSVHHYEIHHKFNILNRNLCV